MKPLLPQAIFKQHIAVLGLPSRWSTVAGLLALGCPAAIAWRVRSVIVWVSVQRMLWRWPQSHIGKKVFKAIEPLIEAIDLWAVIRNGIAPSWVIVGGESGPKARRCDTEWISTLIEQCRAVGVPCFVKQLGSCPCADIECELSEIRDSKGGDWSQWPEDLRVREFPNQKVEADHA